MRHYRQDNVRCPTRGHMGIPPSRLSMRQNQTLLRLWLPRNLPAKPASNQKVLHSACLTTANWKLDSGSRPALKVLRTNECPRSGGLIWNSARRAAASVERAVGQRQRQLRTNRGGGQRRSSPW